MKIAHKIYSIHGGISASILFRAITVLIIIAAFLLEPKTPASAQTLTSDVFYVSVNGSDANPGTLDQPWRTLTYATQRLPAGQTLSTRRGT